METQLRIDGIDWPFATDKGDCSVINVAFAPAFQKHIPSEPMQCHASNLKEALDQAFDRWPKLRGYVLDDQGAIRFHVVIFINSQPASDRSTLQDRLEDGDQVFVFQALSGG
ncbi:MAG: MoaD/ThiS family protein [Pirellulales bacterium]